MARGPFATGGFDRYPSVLRRLSAERGPMTAEVAKRRAQEEPDWWVAHQERAAAVDRAILARRR